MQAREFTGRVVQGPLARGSKSERAAVFIETEGGRYVLRREGGHPLADPALDALVGKTIRCTAFLTERTLIMSSWTVIG